MGLLGLFFAMAIFRLILFCVTVFVVPPGLWLYPNLFEDVGFFDSFKPLWGWQEVGILSLLYSMYANVLCRPRRRRSLRSPKANPLPHRSKNRPPVQQHQLQILQVPWSATWLRRWKRQRSELRFLPFILWPSDLFHITAICIIILVGLVEYSRSVVHVDMCFLFVVIDL